MAPAFNPHVKANYGTAEQVTARAISDLGGLKRAAAVSGRTPSLLHHAANPNMPRSLNYQQVRMMTQGGTFAFVEDLCALAHGSFVPSEPIDVPFSDLISRYSKESGELLSLCIHALADGKITRTEGPALLKEIDDAIRELVAARARIAMRQEAA